MDSSLSLILGFLTYLNAAWPDPGNAARLAQQGRDRPEWFPEEIREFIANAGRREDGGEGSPFGSCVADSPLWQVRAAWTRRMLFSLQHHFPLGCSCCVECTSFSFVHKHASLISHDAANSLAPTYPPRHPPTRVATQAAILGDAECIRLLISAGADPNEGLTRSLIHRLRVGPSWLRELLTLSRHSPLFAACANGDARAALALLDGGADPDLGASLGPFGCVAAAPPIWSAAANGHTRCVRALLGFGADTTIAATLGPRGVIARSSVAWDGDVEQVPPSRHLLELALEMGREEGHFGALLEEEEASGGEADAPPRRAVRQRGRRRRVEEEEAAAEAAAARAAELWAASSSSSDDGGGGGGGGGGGDCESSGSESDSGAGLQWGAAAAAASLQRQRRQRTSAEPSASSTAEQQQQGATGQSSLLQRQQQQPRQCFCAAVRIPRGPPPRPRPVSGDGAASEAVAEEAGARAEAGPLQQQAGGSIGGGGGSTTTSPPPAAAIPVATNIEDEG